MPCFCFLVLFSACQTPAETRTEPNAYYDVENFVQNQIKLFSQQQPSIEKTMVVGEDEEKRNTRAVDWQKEMELFLQADINKPAYRLSYATARPDSLTYEYRLQTEEDLPVRFLKVVLDEDNGKPAVIEAKISSENKLYESEKNLSMRCEERAGIWQITSYRIQGFQELVISDRKPFDVRVIVQ
ncbi:hypothetical protein GCM10007390_03080 [Persicitalea jodogahamensis]|uniref:Uncharacterized protein n=2 Tax=Persicitalea jodogahamensis TaxID=402147 RepID=A0A8J3D4R3_9BACT|nr:hypothetical protein GCM10007390_03080 [Persicitalea jodogahamensis]